MRSPTTISRRLPVAAKPTEYLNRRDPAANFQFMQPDIRIIETLLSGVVCLIFFGGICVLMGMFA
ncbi:MAG: hypothetical protein WBQ60_07940 [Asticcacaulis sp.]